MNSVAPIILVFERSAAELEAALTDLVLRDDDLHYYDELASPENRTRLLYRGVELRVASCDLPADLAEYRSIFLTNDLSKAACGICVDFGGNVAGGARIAPLAQILMLFSARLGQVLGAIGVAWTPARLLSETVYFADAVRSYGDGGAFPVLSTVDFQFSEGVLKTNGLNWFSGQEIELTGQGLPDAELVRRAVRIVHDIAVNGPVLSEQYVPDLDEGKFVLLSPSEDNATVNVKIKSDLEVSST